MQAPLPPPPSPLPAPSTHLMLSLQVGRAACPPSRDALGGTHTSVPNFPNGGRRERQRTAAALKTYHPTGLPNRFQSLSHCITMLAANLAQHRASPSSLASRAGRQRQPCRSRAAVRVCAQAQIDDWAGRQFTLLSTGPAATEHLAATLADRAELADAYCCKGDRGAGKTTFRYCRHARRRGG